MEEKVKTLLDIANSLGFTTAKINPSFKLIILNGTADGVKAYDYDGNRIHFDPDCRYEWIEMDYPTIRGSQELYDEDGWPIWDTTVYLKYEDGKLKVISDNE